MKIDKEFICQHYNLLLEDRFPYYDKIHMHNELVASNLTKIYYSTLSRSDAICKIDEIIDVFNYFVEELNKYESK